MADWVGALAGIAGTGFGIVALWFAKEANTTAAAVRDEARDAAEKSLAIETERDSRALRLEKEAKERELEQEQRENERDQRILAGSLQAWWVKEETGGGSKWGVLLSNDGAATSVFHDVHLKVDANRYTKKIDIKTVPPGRYFIQSVATDKGWEFPEAVADSSTLRPITQAGRYSVNEIQFTDPLGTRWAWTAGSGLVRV